MSVRLDWSLTCSINLTALNIIGGVPNLREEAMHQGIWVKKLSGANANAAAITALQQKVKHVIDLQCMHASYHIIM